MADENWSVPAAGVYHLSPKPGAFWPPHREPDCPAPTRTECPGDDFIAGCPGGSLWVLGLGPEFDARAQAAAKRDGENYVPMAGYGAAEEPADTNVAARAEWESLRDRSSVPVVAVLAIHRPFLGDGYVGCTGCPDRDDSGRNAGWPCETYAAIKEASGD